MTLSPDLRACARACVLALSIAVGAFAPGTAGAQQPVFPLAGAQDIAVGNVSACAVLSGGAVWCWGGNQVGQLGTGVTGGLELIARPSLLVGGATQIASGFSHVCAVVDGGVQCWGNNANGQLGDGTTTASPTPVQAIPAGSGIVEVRAGNAHTCARASGGTVQCWGNNFNGQLGNGATLPGPAIVTSPVAVLGQTDAASLALGSFHSCLVTTTGAARCWGWNGFGQLGNGATNSAGISSPGAVNLLGSGVAQIAAGAQHTCARTDAGAMLCWGDNSQGAIGDGTFVQRLVPTAVSGLDAGVEAIAANDASSCAYNGANVLCWGRGSEAQNGVTFPLSVTQPNVVAGSGAGVAALGARGNVACARRLSGSVICWGENFNGQLGRYYLAWRLRPTAVGGSWGSANVAVAMGYAHACALRANGGVECAGNNAQGQLGNGNLLNSMTPVAVQNLGGATVVASGWLHSCAIVAGGAVRCWGRNTEGQLGNGSNQASSTPVAVTGLTGAVSLAAGAYHSCATTDTGALYCWGRNSEGQLGLGNTTASNTPQLNPTLATGVASVQAGNFHTCALRTPAAGGQAWCWGLNGNGQVGNGNNTSPVTTPVQATATAHRALALGAFHSCAASTATGAVSCWGNNNSGQLGTNSTTQSLVPVSNGLTGANQLALGDFHSCAMLDTSAVQCWGENGRGQVGNTSFTNALVPTPVSGGLVATAISAKLRGTCAVRADTGTSCWGANYWGQFGDDSRQASHVAAAVLQVAPGVLFGDGVEFIGPGPTN